MLTLCYVCIYIHLDRGSWSVLVPSECSGIGTDWQSKTEGKQKGKKTWLAELVRSKENAVI